MLASPLYMQSREDCESSRRPIAPEKPASLLPLGSEETGNQPRSSVFKHADPSNLGRSLLEGNKDHLLSQARSELVRQEHQVGSLNNCISELQQQAYAWIWELQDAQHGFFESRRKHVRRQEELSTKEKMLRDTQIRSMHEIGEMKRAQEKVERQSRDNSTAHFEDAGNARTDEFYEWMMQDNFKKWNQITVEDCRTFPVNLQWFQVLVPCSAATIACLLTHGKTFSVINFLRLIHAEIIIKEFIAHHKENEDQIHKQQGQMKLFSQELTNKVDTQYQCRHLQQGRRLRVLYYWWSFRRILWLDSKDSKFRSCNSTNSPIHNRSWFGKFDSKIKWLLVLNLRWKQCYGSKKSRWLIHKTNWNPRDPFLERIFQILRCWTRRSLLLWTRSSRIPNSRRRSLSRNRRPRKRTRFYEEVRSPSWSTTVHDAVWDYADLFSVTLHDDSIQKFDTWWDEVLPSMFKIPSNDILERLCKLRIRESVQLKKNVLQLYDMEIHQKISMPKISKIDDNGEEEYRSETLITKLLTPGTEELKQEQRSRIEREWVALKEEKVLVTRGKQKASVRKETNAGSCMRVTIVPKNQATMPPRGKEVSEAKVVFSDNRADIWKVLARDRLVNVGILRNVIRKNRNGTQSQG